MTNPSILIACPRCAQPVGAACIDSEAFVADPTHPVYLSYIHAERVEAAAFESNLGQPTADRAFITDAEILGTGLV